MARITVEDCLKKVDNRFALIHLCAQRVRQLRKGSEPLIKSKNTDVVVSLREIAEGEVFRVAEDDIQNLLIESNTDLDSPEIQEQPAQEASIEKEPAQGDVSIEE